MMVRELRALLAKMSGDLQVVIPGDAHDDDAEERPIANVVTRESMFGEGKIVAIVREEAWE